VNGHLGKWILTGTFVLATRDAAAADAFRYSRPVTAPSGWTRLEIPPDVLAACRRGLPDLRVTASGTDVPYVLEQSLGAVDDTWALTNVESVNGVETTAIADRGAHPSAAVRATIDVAAPAFLKPVVLEASDDRATWKEFARGSIFATGGARMTTLRFAPNDRRYWRVRLDDRNGSPVVPRSLAGAATGASRDAADAGAPGPSEIALKL
jgi:hypothetical protein